MDQDLQMHDVVALLVDLPEHGLVRGHVGTVVVWAPGAYEVEFADSEGRTFAMVSLRNDQLLRLYYEPLHQAA